MICNVRNPWGSLLLKIVSCKPCRMVRELCPMWDLFMRNVSPSQGRWWWRTINVSSEEEGQVGKSMTRSFSVLGVCFKKIIFRTWRDLSDSPGFMRDCAHLRKFVDFKVKGEQGKGHGGTYTPMIFTSLPFWDLSELLISQSWAFTICDSWVL